MKHLLRPLKQNEPKDVYLLFQAIPAKEEGFDNDAYGLSKTDFKEFIKHNMDRSKGIGLDKGYSSHTIYVFFVDGKPVGISKIRTYSDNSLLRRGGHIGCAINPILRGKGYGTLLMKETIKEAHRKGLKDILIGCYSDNLPSVHIIEKNGGILEEDKSNISWYWIKPKKPRRSPKM